MWGLHQEKAKLAREVEDLNNTVFSKSFKAPSAWAEREVKYKMEKRDWDEQSRKLREALAKVEAENARYRAENKAAEFEAQIQVQHQNQTCCWMTLIAKCRLFPIGRSLVLIVVIQKVNMYLARLRPVRTHHGR